MAGPLRILVACKHVPYWGGDSTIGYLLCQQLQARGVEAHYANLVEAATYPELIRRLGADAANPLGLPNVHVVFVRAVHEPEPERVHALVRRIRPEVALAVNIAAAVQLRPAAPDTPLWFWPSSSFQLKAALTRGIVRSALDARAALEAGRAVPRTHDMEAQVVAEADRILCHSGPMRAWFEYFYPEHRTKLAPALLPGDALLREDLRRFQAPRMAFRMRPIDLLFVANRWDRPEKNPALMRELIGRSPDLVIHVAGECAPRPPHAVYHQFVRREALIRLMGQVRAVVSPSLYDAAPNVLVEGHAMGCNVVASRNCGNWTLCPPDLLVEPFTTEVFLQRIRRAVTRDYAGQAEAPPAGDAAQYVLDLAGARGVRVAE
jgi:glycosyltransferase involved in cell wall biosynthesis